ncbi:hypothetical protein BC831DRAFT_435171 [Entophlyctis helioformis]|nr:hypothetical protein BC831DRAFT_435171 [Entophlyctis helioformis]
MSTRQSLPSARAKGKPPVGRLVELRVSDSRQAWERAGFTVTDPLERPMAFPETPDASFTPSAVSPFVRLDNINIILLGGLARRQFVGWSFETSPMHTGDMFFDLSGGGGSRTGSSSSSSSSSLSTCLVSGRDSDREMLTGTPSTLSTAGSGAPVGGSGSKHANGASRLSRVVIHASTLAPALGALMGMLEMVPIAGLKKPIEARGQRFVYLLNRESGVIIELVVPASQPSGGPQQQQHGGSGPPSSRAAPQTATASPFSLTLWGLIFTTASDLQDSAQFLETAGLMAHPPRILTQETIKAQRATQSRQAPKAGDTIDASAATNGAVYKPKYIVSLKKDPGMSLHLAIVGPFSQGAPPQPRL